MTDPTRDLLPEGLEDRLPQAAAARSALEYARRGPDPKNEDSQSSSWLNAHP